MIDWSDCHCPDCDPRPRRPRYVHWGDVGAYVIALAFTCAIVGLVQVLR